MSATIILPHPAENKKNAVPAKCLLWRICPIVTGKDRECVHKGDSSCKEFLTTQQGRAIHGQMTEVILANESIKKQ